MDARSKPYCRINPKKIFSSKHAYKIYQTYLPQHKHSYSSLNSLEFVIGIHHHEWWESSGYYNDWNSFRTVMYSTMEHKWVICFYRFTFNISTKIFLNSWKESCFFKYYELIETFPHLKWIKSYFLLEFKIARPKKKEIFNNYFFEKINKIFLYILRILIDQCLLERMILLLITGNRLPKN